MKTALKTIIVATGLFISSAAVADAQDAMGIDNVVVYDQDGITFTVKSDEISEWDEYVLNVEIENTTEKDIMVSLNNTSVNGWVCDPFWAIDITAGNKAVEKVTWYSSDFEELEIDDIKEITSEFVIYDKSIWDVIDSSEFRLAPEGEDAPVFAEREAKETDDVLLETDDIVVSVVSFENKNDWDESVLHLYVNNKTEKNVMVAMENVAVNGTMCDPYWASEIPAGKQAYCEVAWYDVQLQEMEIEAFEKVEFDLGVYDYETFDVLQSESCSIDMANTNIVLE